MGCDIHPVILVDEYADHSHPLFSPVAIPRRDRYYRWFGILAGVRSNLTLFPETLGLRIQDPWRENHPPGCYDFELEKFLSDEHSPHWFSFRRMQEFSRKYGSKNEFEETRSIFDNWYMTMGFFETMYKVGPDDVICVFDFDS